MLVIKFVNSKEVCDFIILLLKIDFGIFVINLWGVFECFIFGMFWGVGINYL